uniref:RRM domain-containing protein n=1 Tax=Fagus sylvatica TaxID=28930 RepID=A0A2N9IUP9_FAGSY
MRDAIEGMNGHSLDGRNITVNEAQSRGNGGGGGGGGGYSRGGGSKIEEDSLILTQINQSHGFCSGFRILNLMMMKSILERLKASILMEWKGEVAVGEEEEKPWPTVPVMPTTAINDTVS